MPSRSLAATSAWRSMKLLGPREIRRSRSSTRWRPASRVHARPRPAASGKRRTPMCSCSPRASARALFAAALRMAIAAKLLPWTVEETDAGIVACMGRWVAQRGNVDTAGEIVRAAQQVARELVAGLNDRFIHIKKVSGKWVPVSEADELRLRTPELFDGFAKPDFILIRPEAWKRYTNGFDPSVIAEQLKRRGALIGSGSEMSKSEE